MGLRFKSRISIPITIISSLDLLILMISGLFLIYKSIAESDWICALGIFLLSLGYIQFINYINIFYLSEKKLQVRFPLRFFNSNHIYKIKDINEITFCKGFKSPFIVIRKNNTYDEDTFRINFRNSEINNFIAELKNLGINTIRKDF